MQHMTTEELFKLRDEQERKLKEKSETYSTKLRKRSPKKYRSSTEFLSPVIKRGNRREFFRESRILIIFQEPSSSEKGSTT